MAVQRRPREFNDKTPRPLLTNDRQAHNFSRSKAEPIRMSADTGSSTKPPPDTGNVKTEVAGQKMVMQDGSMYPEVRTSKLDLDQIPTFDALGKPITDVDLDADIALDTKPWRVPGTDPTDFFNYGFDEFTWVQYCLKQKQMRESITGMKSETKQFEAMLGGQPAQGMPAMPSMPGMPDMPPEMLAAMFGNMQANGGDPSQMDFGAMMQQMGGMPGMPGPGGQFGGMPPGPGFNPGGATPQQSANDDFGNTGDQRDGMFRQQGGYNRRGRGRGRY